jgi:hypothetical protein
MWLIYALHGIICGLTVLRRLFASPVIALCNPLGFPDVLLDWFCFSSAPLSGGLRRTGFIRP